MVTGSIWGCHLSPERREIGFSERWHTTAGKIELTALAHNETVLPLDETKRAGRTNKDRAQAVLDISFGLAENVEKERLTNVGSIRGWRFYFLSTSNYSLDELAKRAGLEIDDAERGRLVDIPIPDAGHGIYENLHQFADGGRFTDSLKIRCRKYCGAVGKEFVRQLVTDRAKDPAELRTRLKRERKAYLHAINAQAQELGLRPLNRASGRFATVFAAGVLAINYGLFPWKREELLQAILSCQVDGLRQAAADLKQADTSVAGLRRKLMAYITDNRGKFRNLDKRPVRVGKHTFGSTPGYIAKFKGKKWIYLTADRLKAVIGAGNQVAQLKQELAAEGVLERGAKGNYLIQCPIFAGEKGNKGHKWVHAFRIKLLQSSS
jgi:putative DNA primase/helicase